MPFTLGQLRSMQADAVKAAKSLGYTYEELTDGELEKFGVAFERSFVLAYAEREIVDLYTRHAWEALLGAIIAKKQMSAEIDGEQPGAGKVGGPIAIRAGFLGIGDDWEDVGDTGTFATGAPVNWIHSGTPIMGGTDGDAVKIGENQVTVVIGFGSRHPSPKVESVKFEIDGKPKPVLITDLLKRPDALKIKEFDNCYVLKHDTTVLAEIFASAQHGATVADIPYLLGFSYIKEDQLRVHDPADLPGTTPDVILTT